MRTPRVGFTTLRGSPTPRRRIVCFPHAGGSVGQFREWPAILGPDTEITVVLLPGRYDRAVADPFRSVAEAAKAVADAIVASDWLPTALFGHSLGALLAFETARSLPRNAARLLVVSGAAAPHLPSETCPIAGLPDAEFLGQVRMLGATPEAIFASRELVDAILPALRADFAMAEEYQYKVGLPLSCPILALGGTADQGISEDQMFAWKAHTIADAWIELFPGNHFFIDRQRTAVLTRIREALRYADDGRDSRPLRSSREPKALSLVMAKGLPAAGKTTWARREVASHDDAPVRLSLDDLRQMFFDGRQSAESEEFVVAARDALANLALAHSRSVVVDATNLDPRHEESLRQIVARHPSARFDIADFTSVPLETCVRRDLQRERPVGEAIIRDMYLTYVEPRRNGVTGGI